MDIPAIYKYAVFLIFIYQIENQRLKLNGIEIKYYMFETRVGEQNEGGGVVFVFVCKTESFSYEVEKE